MIAGKVDVKNQNLVILMNKVDLLGVNKNVKTFNNFVLNSDILENNTKLLEISAKSGFGHDELRSTLVSCSGLASATGTLVTKARHAAALRAATPSLSAVSDVLDRGLPTDLLAEDLRAALEALGSITGQITTDETLGEIFSRFCIGK